MRQRKLEAIRHCQDDITAMVR